MNHSIVSIVKGGLGNQLFIYAASRAMALRLKRELYLDTVLGFQDDSFSRQYRLDRFKIIASEVAEGQRLAPSLKHPKHKLIRAINRFFLRDSRSYFSERWGVGASQLTALKPKVDRITLLGYWQDEAYFADYSDEIRRELALPLPSNIEIKQLGDRYRTNESVFIHFRRINYNHVLSLDYYQRAIDAICERVSEPHFVLFGDSVEEPSRQLDFRSHKVDLPSFEQENELSDLWLMSQCRHAIIANSTFSWWAAWLRDIDRVGQVYAPETMGHALVPAAGWMRLPN